MTELFLLGFALAASPGPDFVLILRHTLVYGRGMGYATLAGNRVSLCLHMAFAMAGISAVLRTSPALFLGVRLLGAGYLIWLGVRNLVGRFRRGGPAAVAGGSESQPPPAPREAFRQGFLNNLLNPKVSLFFLSLFPQVATPDKLAGSPSVVALSFFAGNCAWWVPLVAVVGFAGLRALILRFQQALDAVFGVLFVAFGLRIAAEVFSDIH